MVAPKKNIQAQRFTHVIFKSNYVKIKASSPSSLHHFEKETSKSFISIYATNLKHFYWILKQFWLTYIHSSTCLIKLKQTKSSTAFNLSAINFQTRASFLKVFFSGIHIHFPVIPVKHTNYKWKNIKVIRSVWKIHCWLMLLNSFRFVFLVR